jgi:shikimate dehydrogenase
MSKPITGTTQVVGIFGYPVEHSSSPAMHNAAFSQLGLDYVYVPFEVRPGDLERAVDALRAMNIAGVNLTIPHKEAVIPFLDEVSEEVSLIGAANTIKVENGKLMGFNTDAQGFLESLQENRIEPRGTKVLVIGAGGASRAVVCALTQAEVSELTIANRTLERAEELAGKMNELAKNIKCVRLSDISAEVENVDLIVNTTSVGMKPDDPPLLDAEVIRPEHKVVDIIYNPPETPLLRSARLRGAATLNGMGMLVNQGAISFEIWTGVAPPRELMRKILEGKGAAGE